MTIDMLLNPFVVFAFLASIMQHNNLIIHELFIQEANLWNNQVHRIMHIEKNL